MRPTVLETAVAVFLPEGRSSAVVKIKAKRYRFGISMNDRFRICKVVPGMSLAEAANGYRPIGEDVCASGSSGISISSGGIRTTAPSRQIAIDTPRALCLINARRAPRWMAAVTQLIS